MLFRPLLPDCVLLAEMAPESADPAQLAEAEQATLGRAVDKRRREYAAGRLLARALLQQAGAPVEALLSDPDRVPRWPAGVHGSITHCAGLCAVAVVEAGAAAGVGIDVEPARPLGDELREMILRPAELARVAALPPPLRDLGGMLTFSIKEAVYKAIYPHRRVFLEFHQVELCFEGEDGFVADVLLPDASLPGLSRIRGRFRIAEGYIAAAVLLPTSATR